MNSTETLPVPLSAQLPSSVRRYTFTRCIPAAGVQCLPPCSFKLLQVPAPLAAQMLLLLSMRACSSLLFGDFTHHRGCSEGTICMYVLGGGKYS